MRNLHKLKVTCQMTLLQTKSDINPNSEIPAQSGSCLHPRRGKHCSIPIHIFIFINIINIIHKYIYKFLVCKCTMLQPRIHNSQGPNHNLTNVASSCPIEHLLTAKFHKCVKFHCYCQLLLVSIKWHSRMEYCITTWKTHCLRVSIKRQ